MRNNSLVFIALKLSFPKEILNSFMIYMILLLVSSIFIGCPKRNIIRENGKVTEYGIASWYGPGFHGKKTANGETYNMYAFTAAHKEMEFGTMVKVVNLDNGKSVMVRINDRGPFVKGRIIDLSHSAAQAIDMLGSGTANVRLEYNTDNKSDISYIQVASFSNKVNAEELKKNLSKKYLNVFIEQKDEFYRVKIGPITSESKCKNIMKELEAKGYSPIITH